MATGADGKRIFTAGHGNRSLEALLAVLHDGGIGCVVDVRSHPASRRFPWFAREHLAAGLEADGIGYEWAGRALGGKRRHRGDDGQRHPALAPGLAAFARHMDGTRFAEACAELVGRARDERLALLCAEIDPARCHRWLIADYLVAIAGLPVEHLREPGRSTPHRPSTAARRDGGRLRYDAGHTASLLPGE
jgi:uncharacterized protein (DUF488 family)